VLIWVRGFLIETQKMERVCNNLDDAGCNNRIDALVNE
jgi:hypothetical protein